MAKVRCLCSAIRPFTHTPLFYCWLTTGSKTWREIRRKKLFRFSGDIINSRRINRFSIREIFYPLWDIALYIGDIVHPQGIILVYIREIPLCIGEIFYPLWDIALYTGDIVHPQGIILVYTREIPLCTGEIPYPLRDIALYTGDIVHPLDFLIYSG